MSPQVRALRNQPPPIVTLPFQTLDYAVIAAYVLLMIVVGTLATRRRQESLTDYFTGGKNLPWWLIGISMVATTFAADTPLAVTGIIAAEGVAGNWIWWNFMFSGLVTVFFYAKLWKRADVITDVEFIAIRYSGRPARILRGFRALYLAFPINCIILGWVTIGMAKILTVLLGVQDHTVALSIFGAGVGGTQLEMEAEWMIILSLYLAIGLYITFSGIWGVVVTDFIQFIIAMGGSVVLAWYAVDYAGGLGQLKTDLAQQFGADHSMLSLNPFANPEIALATALVWVGMMWWASWYPGAEPGGGGYIAQRMFSAKNERHAVGGTLLFNVAHYALRPWPWILVGLVALVAYPGLEDPETGYPLLMLELLPAGLLGLLAVAFLAAFVSTVSTHLNWGASYLVNDFYKPFVRPPEAFGVAGAGVEGGSADAGAEDGSAGDGADAGAAGDGADAGAAAGGGVEDVAEAHYVRVSRVATVLIMLAAIGVSLLFDTVRGGWELILSIGAGTGLVYLLRWYWGRINAWSEISAMSAAAAGSLIAPWLGLDDFASKMIFTTLFSTAVWVPVTLLTRPTDSEHLRRFFERVMPESAVPQSAVPQSAVPQSAVPQSAVPEDAAPSTGFRVYEPVWKPLLSVCLSAAAIILSLVGMGQIFFGVMGLGITLVAAGVAALVLVVRKV